MGKRFDLTERKLLNSRLTNYNLTSRNSTSHNIFNRIVLSCILLSCILALCACVGKAEEKGKHAQSEQTQAADNYIERTTFLKLKDSYPVFDIVGLADSYVYFSIPVRDGAEEDDADLVRLVRRKYDDAFTEELPITFERYLYRDFVQGIIQFTS